MELDTLKEHLEYLSLMTKEQGMSMDWQGKKIFLPTLPHDPPPNSPRLTLDFEDSETIIYYNIRLLEKNSNVVTIDERYHNGTLFRIGTRSESILQLAYYANQVNLPNFGKKYASF